MAPFPEAEIMTIKRLEVALRKMDYKLLKDGAYKLHEKFHSGHRFEYLDLLKDILIEITNNPSIPADVKEILSPTIEDILAQGGSSVEKVVSVEEYSEEQDLVFDKNVREEQKEFKLNAFDAFSPQKQEAPTKYFSQSPFSAEPFKEFNPSYNMPTVEPVYEEPEMYQEIKSVSFDEIDENETHYIEEAPTVINNEEKNYTQSPIQEPTLQQMPTQAVIVQDNMVKEEIVQPTVAQDVTFEEEKDATLDLQALQQEQEKKQEYQETNKFQIQQEDQQEIKQEVAVEKKTVSIFYGQDSSNDKIKNISKLREIIKNTRDKNNSIDDLLVLISEVSLQADTNVIELQGVLEKLKNNGNYTNLITNSQSAMYYELLEKIEAKYAICEDEKKSNINLIPLYGLSNLFVCEECSEKYLDKSSGAKPLILECPECKHPMYPDFYSASVDAQINLEAYNNGLVNLANSKIWLLIHPSFNDKLSSDLILCALKTSSCVEEVYILDKDINTKEIYKNTIAKIKPNVKVNVQGNALEEFFNKI